MPSSVRATQARLVRAMSPERRLLVSEQLRRAAWDIKAAWISGK